MAPLTVPPSLAKSASVPSPASIIRASMVPLVDGLMGAAAMRMLNAAGETALASAETGSHILWAANGSTLTFCIPMSRNFLAAHSIARSHAAEPVGRPPMPSHSSRKSVISGVSACARAARRCGASCASKAGTNAIRTSQAEWGGRPRPRRPPWSGCRVTPELKADVSVGRGPGGPPHSPIPIIPVNHSLFHHERDLFHLTDILNRISRNHDKVGQLSRFQRADLVLETQQLPIHGR